MPVTIQWPQSSALVKRLRDMEAQAANGGKACNMVKGDIRIIAETDHEEKMLRGVDRYGVPRAELSPRTLANPRRGPNPNSLIPHGRASRFIMLYYSDWQSTGPKSSVLVQGFKGAPRWMAYHLTGATKPGTNWVLPRRDVGGITPQGWARIVERHKQYAADVLKGGR